MSEQKKSGNNKIKISRRGFLYSAASVFALGLLTKSRIAFAGITGLTFWKKKAVGWSGTISANQLQMNLATWATGQGWNGTMAATITINAGVYIWSDNTATPALTTGSFPGGLTLINNGYIMGKGGHGSDVLNTDGETGGPAISLNCNLTIDLTNAGAYIGGGGGGGRSVVGKGGGGAGGGVGGGGGGAGGTVGNVGGNGVLATGVGAGGGRIMPGVGGLSSHSQSGDGGTANAVGGANGTGTGVSSIAQGGGSGGGGQLIAAKIPTAGAGGGGWGAAGGSNLGGGLGGKAIALNGNSVTWVSGNSTRAYGAVS